MLQPYAVPPAEYSERLYTPMAAAVSAGGTANGSGFGVWLGRGGGRWQQSLTSSSAGGSRRSLRRRPSPPGPMTGGVSAVGRSTTLALHRTLQRCMLSRNGRPEALASAVQRACLNVFVVVHPRAVVEVGPCRCDQ